MNCLWCGGALRMTAAGLIVHADDGRLYKGTCSCEGIRHEYSHDDFGSVACPTWRDDHVATVKRS